MVKAVRDNKVVLQTGTQQRSSQRFRMACELVRNGRIGKLKEVTVWLPAGLRGGPFDSTAGARRNSTGISGRARRRSVRLRARALPRHLPQLVRLLRRHHDRLGRAPHGHRLLGDRPARTDRASRARRSTTPIPGGYTAISDYEVKFTYPNGVIFNVRTTPDDSPFGAVINPDGQRNGIRFEGTDGWIWVNRDEINATDRELLSKPLPDDAERLYVSNDHMGNFFDCINTRKDPICPVEIGHRSASVCHLGAISLRTGKACSGTAKGNLHRRTRRRGQPLRRPRNAQALRLLLCRLSSARRRRTWLAAGAPRSSSPHSQEPA